MSHFWQQTMIWLFGGGHPDAGEGFELSVGSQAPWAPWITLLVVILAVTLVTIFYLRERSGNAAAKSVLIALRLAVIGLVVFMLYEFVLLPFRTDLPDIVVMLDVSDSMHHVDQYLDEKLQQDLHDLTAAEGWDEPSRLNIARTWLMQDDGETLRKLASKYHLKIFTAGEASRGLSGDGENLADAIRALDVGDSQSRLGSCLQSVLEGQRGRPTAAVILVSDGITTEGRTIGEAAVYAGRKRVPLFVVAVGSDQPPRDVRVSDLLVDEVVFVKDIINFEFNVTSTGFAGSTAEVQIRVQGTSEILARQSIQLGSDGQPMRVQIPYQPPEQGQFEYVVQVVPVVGEASTENNQVTRIITVRDDKIKVLLVQSYPNYEFRYLKNVLLRDSQTVQLTTVLQEADAEYASLDVTASTLFPIRREELFEYDVIIFGDVDSTTHVGGREKENLAEFVKVKGGGVVFIAGPHYTPADFAGTPLEELLPFDLSTATIPRFGQSLDTPFVMRPTELGIATVPLQLGSATAETLAIWQNLPGLYWMLDAPSLKPGARVLAEHPSRTGNDGRPLPLICMQYVGAGKVVFHATDETWRWRYQVGDVFFARYWIQMVRYLSRSKLWGQDDAVEITSDRKSYHRGVPVRLRVRFLDDRAAPPSDDGVAVVLEEQGGKNRRLQLHRLANHRGVFTSGVNNLGEGSYHAWLATPTVEGGAPSHDFTVDSPPGERARLETDATDLKLAAERSGGQFFTVAQLDDVVAALPRGRQVRIESLDRAPIWNSWKIALLFVALIVAEWLLRKKSGML